jgi:hypothetical protein
MGMDFIQKAKRGFRKGWERGRQKLTSVDLFLRLPGRKIRTILVVPFGPENFHEGDQYELNVEHGRIFVYRERVPIGVCKEPSQSILNEMTDLGGKALGAFYKVREHSGFIEIVVCIGSHAKEQVA